MSDRRDVKISLREGTTEVCVAWGFDSAGPHSIMFELSSRGLKAYSFMTPASARALSAALLRAADDEDARAAATESTQTGLAR